MHELFLHNGNLLVHKKKIAIYTYTLSKRHSQMFCKKEARVF